MPSLSQSLSQTKISRVSGRVVGLVTKCLTGQYNTHNTIPSSRPDAARSCVIDLSEEDLSHKLTCCLLVVYLRDTIRRIEWKNGLKP